MKDSIVVLGTHLTNYNSNLIITELISSLINNDFDYGVVANSLVPDTHYVNSKFFMYDSENDKFDETPSSNFWFENEYFKIESPLLNYGAIPNYSFGATNLFINAVLLSKRYGYKYLHWLEYDSHLYVDEIKDNENILKTTNNTCIIYETNSDAHPINGSFISINLEKINLTNFFQKKDVRLNKLHYFGNSGERFTKEFLLENEIFYCKKNKTIPLEHKFNQARENPVEFVYYEHNNELSLFLKNNKNRTLSFSLQTNLNFWENTVEPFCWTILDLGITNDLNYLLLSYDNTKLFIDLKNEIDFEKYIKRNKFYKK